MPREVNEAVASSRKSTTIYGFLGLYARRTGNVAHEPTALGPMRQVIDEPGHKGEEEELKRINNARRHRLGHSRRAHRLTAAVACLRHTATCCRA